jgi:hypothetical protein
MKTKILRNTLLSVGAGLAAVLTPVTAHSSSLVAFNAELNHSSLVSESCNGGVCNLVFQGTGSSNIMGPVTWTAQGVQDFNTSPCNPAAVTITLVGSAGSITVSDSCGIVCPSATNYNQPDTINSVWNVTGGTGSFSGITGSGTTQGTISPHGDSPVVHLSGVVLY